jgi:hypothetical protein
MGWSYMKKRDAHNVGDRVEFVKRELFGIGYAKEPRYEVVEAAAVGSTVYMAVRIKAADLTSSDYVPDAEGRVTVGVVVLTDAKGGEIGWKDMDEGMGPNESSCPAKVLNALSELTPDAGGHAKDWRARCRANLAARRENMAAALKLAEGAVVKLAKPVEFRDGTKADTFRVTYTTRRGRRKRVYLGLNGGRYSFPARLLSGATVAPSA